MCQRFWREVCDAKHPGPAPDLIRIAEMDEELPIKTDVDVGVQVRSTMLMFAFFVSIFIYILFLEVLDRNIIFTHESSIHLLLEGVLLQHLSDRTQRTRGVTSFTSRLLM